MEQILRLLRLRSIFSPNNTEDTNESLTINVVHPHGCVAELIIFPYFTAEEILKIALAEFSEDCEYSGYKLFHVRSEKIIAYNTSMKSAGVLNNDEVCMLLQHQILKNDIPISSAPDQSMIDANTANMPNSSEASNSKTNSIKLIVGGHSYIRNFLTQMAIESAYIISTGPYADFLIEYFKQKIVNRRKDHDDAVKSLAEMGFERSRCVYAMKLKKNIYSEALRWLVDHSDDSNIYRPYNNSMSVTAIVGQDLHEKFQRLLQIIRIYGRNGQHYCEKLLEAFTDMGFDEAESLTALRSCDWNPTSAVDVLCGEPLCKLQTMKSPIVRNVLESSMVQNHLGNPELFMTIIYILGSGAGSSGVEHNWESAKEMYDRVAFVLKLYNDEKLYNITTILLKFSSFFIILAMLYSGVSISLFIGINNRKEIL